MPSDTAQYRTLQDKEARMQSIRADLITLEELTEPTQEDLDVQETLIQEYEALEAEATPLRERLAKLDRIRTNALDPDKREEPERYRPEMPETFVRSNRDPFESLELVERGMVYKDDLRSRALTAIEQDAKSSRYEIDHDKAECATVRSQDDPGVAKHVLLTGSRAYKDAFRHYLEDRNDGAFRSDPGLYTRAINLTSGSGGFLLPYILDPTIVLTNNASANPFRRISRVVQTTSNAWQGVNSAGVTAAFIGEAVTAADNSPTFAQIQITPQKAVAWVLGSYEALDDTNFGVQLPTLLSDAKDRLESAYFTTGSGTAVPLGILPALTAAGNRVAPGATGTAFQSSTATTGGMTDVMNLQSALAPRFRNAPGAAYLGNLKILNAVRALDVYGGAQFWVNLTSNTPPALLGQPSFEGSDMPSATTGASGASGTGSATLLYGDFGQFIIADRVGVSMLYEPMVKGSTNSQLPVGEAGWYMFWRVSSAISTTAAFRYLTIS